MVVSPLSNATMFAMMESVIPMQVNNTLSSPFADVASSWTNITGPFMPSFGFVNATKNDVSIRLDNNLSPMLTVPPSRAILLWPINAGRNSPYGAYFIPNQDGYFPNCGKTNFLHSRSEFLTDLEVLIACAALEAEASNLDSITGGPPVSWPPVLYG